MDLSTVDARKMLAGKYAAKYNIDMALVAAVCEHESSWVPWAIRHEPNLLTEGGGFFSRYIQPLLDDGTVKTLTEAHSRSISWGLMQIMGQTARELGFTGRFLSELCDPDTGVDFGAKKLGRCVMKHPGDVRATLLAYNGGSNPNYPDLVLPLMANYK